MCSAVWSLFYKKEDIKDDGLTFKSMLWKSLDQAGEEGANGIVIETVDAFDEVTCSLRVLY